MTTATVLPTRQDLEQGLELTKDAEDVLSELIAEHTVGLDRVDLPPEVRRLMTEELPALEVARGALRRRAKLLEQVLAHPRFVQDDCQAAAHGCICETG